MNTEYHLVGPDALVRDPHLVHDEVHLAAADGGDRGAPEEDRRGPRRRRHAARRTSRRPRSSVNDELRDARTKANEIIEQAHAARQPDHRPGQERRHRRSATARRPLAEAEIAPPPTAPSEDLRKQVSALAVTGAEKLLSREIDANAHKALLDELAAEI